MERRRPTAGEYAEYYSRYIRKVPEGDIIAILRDRLESGFTLFGNIPEDKQDYCYAPGKWSAREVVGHIIDVEWVFTYRALRFARGDATPLAGMDEDQFMAGANFKERTVESLAVEFRHLRTANTTLFESFGEEILDRRGIAFNNEFTVRAILYVIAGHEAHHRDVLRDRYLC